MEGVKEFLDKTIAWMSSIQFGDQEFVHEVGGYGTADPLLEAALSEYGAGIAKVSPMSEMASPDTVGQAETKYGNYPFDNPISVAIEESRLEAPTTNFITGAKDREFLNDVWRHEYRHQGMDLAREGQDRNFWNVGQDFLGRNRTAPIDYNLNDIFSSDSFGFLPRTFGMLQSTKRNNEEALMRVMDNLYGKSFEARQSGREMLDQMNWTGLIDDPNSWMHNFVPRDMKYRYTDNPYWVEDDHSEILNEIETALETRQ